MDRAVAREICQNVFSDRLRTPRKRGAFSTSERMTSLADGGCSLFIKESDLHISRDIVTEMAAHTGCGILVDCLPAGKEHMEVIIEFLFLKYIGMAL